MAIEVIDKIVQKNGGKFPLMDAKNVVCEDNKTVEEKLNNAGSGGVSSWNDLSDKPFYEEVKQSICEFTTIPTVTFNVMGYTWYKISDLTPSAEQLLSTEFTTDFGSGETVRCPVEAEFLVKNDKISAIQFSTSPSCGFIIAYTTEAVTTDYGTAEAPETGIYFAYEEGATPSNDFVIGIKYTVITQLEEKYIEGVNWSKVTDKPFGEVSLSLTYDGSVSTDTEYIEMDEYTKAVKISDDLSDTESLIGAEVIFTDRGEEITTIIEESMFETVVDGLVWVSSPISSDDGTTYAPLIIILCVNDSVELGEGMTFSKGIYFINDTTVDSELCTKSLSYESVKTLDSKYLPKDTITEWIDEYINKALGGEY